MHRVQAEPGVVEPFGERDGGAPIAVVEMFAQREQLDRLEAMRRDLDEMIAIEPLANVKVRRDSEHSSADYTDATDVDRDNVIATDPAGRAGVRSADTCARFVFTCASVRGMY